MPDPFRSGVHFLLLLLGPFKPIVPFAQVTQQADAMTIRRIAWLGTVFAALALLLAALLDETILAKYGIPVPVLSLSAGHAHGVAALVVFLALSHDLDARLSIGAIVVMIMNLVVMLLTRRLLGLLAVVLPILGAVLGIVQVPLGLQIVHNSLRAMGLL